RAEGDFRPDPDAARFPASPLVVPQPCDWQSLYEEYRQSVEPAAATVKRQLGVLKKFFGFLGHVDPRRVSEEDVRRWLKHRLTEGSVAPQTVRDADLAHPKTLYIWALSEKKLHHNPFRDIKVRVPKQVKLR